MLTSIDIKVGIIAAVSYLYVTLNAYIGKKMKTEFCKTEYKTQYFYTHVNKHPFLFVFFTVFLLMYYKKNKEKYNHGYDLYLLKLIEDTKKSNCFSYFQIELTDEKIIIDRIKKYERKIKLKNLNRFGVFRYML